MNRQPSPLGRGCRAPARSPAGARRVRGFLLPFGAWRMVPKGLRIREVPRHPARSERVKKSALVILSEAKNLSRCSRLQPNCKDSSPRRKSRHSREACPREGGERESAGSGSPLTRGRRSRFGGFLIPEVLRTWLWASKRTLGHLRIRGQTC